MKQLCLILAISTLSNYMNSQSLGDSVIVYIENRVELNVAIPDYINLKSSDKVATALEEFQRMLPELEGQLAPAAPELVKFIVGGSVTIEPGDPKYTYLITDGTLRNTGYRDQVIITGDNYKILITAVDLVTVADIPLATCLEKVIMMLPEKTRVSKSLYYQCVNNEILELKSEDHTNGKIDFLELGLTAGAGLVKNKWVADLSFMAGLGLVRKGVTKYQPYLSTDLIFDFDDSGDIDLNMFLNIGYRPNIIKDPKNSTFLGVDIGYLVVSQGMLFEGTTFKLGVNWSPLKGVFVGPRLYATDNFNRVFPGIRIGFGF
jgi:hypothetical protein